MFYSQLQAGISAAVSRQVAASGPSVRVTLPRAVPRCFVFWLGTRCPRQPTGTTWPAVLGALCAGSVLSLTAEAAGLCLGSCTPRARWTAGPVSGFHQAGAEPAGHTCEGLAALWSAPCELGTESPGALLSAGSVQQTRRHVSPPRSAPGGGRCPVLLPLGLFTHRPPGRPSPPTAVRGEDGRPPRCHQGTCCQCCLPSHMAPSRLTFLNHISFYKYV